MLANIPRLSETVSKRFLIRAVIDKEERLSELMNPKGPFEVSCDIQIGARARLQQIAARAELAVASPGRHPSPFMSGG